MGYLSAVAPKVGMPQGEWLFASHFCDVGDCARELVSARKRNEECTAECQVAIGPAGEAGRPPSVGGRTHGKQRASTGSDDRGVLLRITARTSAAATGNGSVMGRLYVGRRCHDDPLRCDTAV